METESIAIKEARGLSAGQASDSPIAPSEMRAAARFYAANYVRRAASEVYVDVDAALTAMSFLADYYQTEDGRLYVPEGRLGAGVYEVIR